LRGAFGRLLAAADAGDLSAREVVTASRGNAGPAVAYAAARLGMRAEVHVPLRATLARNLAPTPPVSELFGRAGRHWLSRQDLSADERATVAALLRQLDFHGTELAIVDKELAVEAPADPMVPRLMTIPGVDASAGISIVAAVGDFTRFDDPNKLAAYVGLNPRGAGPGPSRLGQPATRRRRHPARRRPACGCRKPIRVMRRVCIR
jgi:transposase